MITQEEAYNYKEQLHPAFAGYLHDGTVNQRDVLATLFQLFKKDALIPEFSENNMLRNIHSVRRGKKKPQFAFEEELIDTFLANEHHVSSKHIGEIIEKGFGEEIIKNHVSVIEKFPIIENTLQFSDGRVRFSLNGEQIDTIEEAQDFKKKMNWIIMPVLFGVGLLLVMLYFLVQSGSMQVNIESDVPNPEIWILYSGGICLFVALSMFLAFTFSKKTVTYSFENNVLPKAKEYYDQLYEYMKTHPLKDHVFTNEFLPHTIAFGLDDSWQKDFGLEKEIQVDEVIIEKS